MSRAAHAGSFWSGAGAGIGLGLAAALALGWWLSTESPTLPVPSPPAASPGPTTPTSVPTQEPQEFSPPAERLVEAKEADRLARTAAEEGLQAPATVPTTQPQVEPEVIATQRASDPPVPAAPPPVVEGDQIADVEEPVGAQDLIRNRYDSLSDALLAEDAGASGELLPPLPATEDAPSTEVLPEDASSAGQWIDVWQPFVSPVSARGFADRLELLTGFTYRVQRRAGDGLHQVEVLPPAGYAPAQMLQQIEDRSGLAMVSP